MAKSVSAASQGQITSSIARAVQVVDEQRESFARAMQARKELTSSIGRAVQIADQERLSISNAFSAAAQVRSSISSLFEQTEAIRLAQELRNSDVFRLANEFRDAFRLAQEFRNSDAFRTARDSHASITGLVRHLQNSPTLAFVERTERWATQFSATGFLSTVGDLATQVSQIESVAASIRNLGSGLDRLKGEAARAIGTMREMEPTRLKLAVLAGSSDVLGFKAGATVAAYQNLFGQWHTKPDLPKPFWHEAEVRRRHYVEAEVDPGLIGATPTAAIEVAIESGFAAGVRGDHESVAIFDVAGVSMRIRSSNTRFDAFQVVDTFETALREFLARKLGEVAGTQWFKQRVHGDLVAKARQNRATAMANGEREVELLSYLDLGDLTSIILQKNNWGEVFEQVFPNRERLSHDLQALVATRRPTMHARHIDAVRLVEMMCIVRRLTDFIEDDGGWKRISDAEQ
jgi:hypothetical protein